MELYELWERARKHTEIIRLRAHELSTFSSTTVPYVFLGESSVNAGNTVVRSGQVVIERPAIILPSLSPQFEGFEFDPELHLSDDAVATFLLVRGIQFPSLKYRHHVSSLDVFEDSLQRAIEHYTHRFTMAEDLATGLVVGLEEAWQFSVLLLVGALVVRSAEGDLRRILEERRRRQREQGR
jgi:hypothetical protein